MTVNQPRHSNVTPRELNAMAVAKIRSAPAQPYADGQHVLRVLTVSGRATDVPQVLPLAVTQVHGHRYLCSPSRRRDWVRNLAAAGTCHIEHDVPSDYHAIRVDGEEAVTAISTYLGNVVRLRGTAGPNMWPFPKDAPREDIRPHLDSVAVFRVTPDDRREPSTQ